MSQARLRERRRNPGQKPTPALGTCIRRITVNNAGRDLDSLMSPKLGRSFEHTIEDAYDNYEDETQKWRVAADKIDHRLEEVCRPNLFFVISKAQI